MEEREKDSGDGRGAESERGASWMILDCTTRQIQIENGFALG